MIQTLAPITPTGLICLGCGGQLRMEIEKFKNGKVSNLLAYCDTCKYGFQPSMIHAQGTNAKYIPPAEKPVPSLDGKLEPKELGNELGGGKAANA